ncbi:hypothetical protein [Yoonia sp. BS5-3]|uniref:Outer membrane protein beta-barrel domain-containing protein n=1 Tax=Yoonia phaeophyticola TaxID=3137369 RepID=A0ABZ2V4X0_9RHOB
MTYRHMLLTMAAAGLIPGAVAAENLTFGTDLELEVDDTNSTLTLTPSLEYTSDIGIYIGADLSNEDSETDDYGVSTYVGYAGEFGLMSYDLYYGRYYLNETGDDGQEAIVTIGYPVFGGLSGSTALTSDLEETETITQGFAYALPASYELSGAYEFSEEGDDDSWDVGLSKTLTEAVSLDWRYYDSDAGPESFAMTVSFASDVAGWFDG